LGGGGGFVFFKGIYVFFGEKKSGGIFVFFGGIFVFSGLVFNMIHYFLVQIIHGSHNFGSAVLIFFIVKTLTVDIMDKRLF
jgi:hypothetical protein